MLTNDQLAAALADRPGERVTPDYIESRMARVEYHTLPKSTVTVCNITLDNGFSVRGESACVDPANYDRAIGEKIAHDNAFQKLWPLFGFLLAEARHHAGAKAGRIARLCHEVNRAACSAFGDHSQPPWEQAPDWQKTSAVKGVEFAIANPDAGPSASHDSWLAEKEATGWKYGPVKNPETKEHPCFVPYDELPPEQKLKDHLFQAVVRTSIA